MDKSFNDQELSDIMKEIEALEDNFQNEVGKMEASEAEVMEELAQLDEEEAFPAKAEAPAPEPEPEIANVVPMAQHSPSPSFAAHPQPHFDSKPSPAPASMSFKVSGELNLELQFDIEGKVVSLAVNEHGLNIQMEGGMTFSIPIKKAA